MPLPTPVSRRSGHGAATPLRRLCALHAHSPVTDLPVAPAPAERHRVLLVESDPALRTLLIEMLSRHYEVEAVSDDGTQITGANLIPSAVRKA